MVLVSPSVKICDFPSSFFLLFFSLLACWTCWSYVGEAKKEEEEEEEDTARTPESSKSYRFWCPTCVGHQHVSNIDTTPKMACRCNLDSVSFFFSLSLGVQ